MKEWIKDRIGYFVFPLKILIFILYIWFVLSTDSPYEPSPDDYDYDANGDRDPNVDFGQMYNGR